MAVIVTCVRLALCLSMGKEGQGMVSLRSAPCIWWHCSVLSSRIEQADAAVAVRAVLSGCAPHLFRVGSEALNAVARDRRFQLAL